MVISLRNGQEVLPSVCYDTLHVSLEIKSHTLRNSSWARSEMLIGSTCCHIMWASFWFVDSSQMDTAQSDTNSVTYVLDPFAPDSFRELGCMID